MFSRPQVLLQKVRPEPFDGERHCWVKSAVDSACIRACTSFIKLGHGWSANSQCIRQCSHMLGVDAANSERIRPCTSFWLGRGCSSRLMLGPHWAMDVVHSHRIRPCSSLYGWAMDHGCCELTVHYRPHTSFWLGHGRCELPPHVGPWML